MPANSLKPVPKVAAAGAGGVFASLLIIIANGLGLDLPPEVAAGIVTVVTFAAGYLMPDKKPKA